MFFIKTILGTSGPSGSRTRSRTPSGRSAAGTGGIRFPHRDRSEGKQYISGIEEPKLLTDALRRFKNIAGVSENFHGAGMIRSSFKSEPAQVYGINLDDQLRVSDLERQIVQGSLDDFGVRRRRASRPRDGGPDAAGGGSSFILDFAGESRRYRVSALYQTGVSDIDRVRVY